MLHAAWQPLAGTFGMPREASPLLLSASRLPTTSEGLRHHLREYGLVQSPEPSPSLQSLGVINVPVFVKREGRVVLPVSGYHNFRDTFGSRHLREGAIPNT